MISIKNFQIKQFGQLSVSVIDQGLYSVNNFLINILLARVILPTAYGEYSVAFSIFLFISGFQNALITEPMSVVGPIQFHLNQKQYLRKLSIINFTLTAFASLLLLIYSAIFPTNSLTYIIIPMAISMPFLLNFWFFRRFCYVIESPQKALAGTIVYSALLLGSTLFLMLNQTFNGVTAYYLMGISGLLGSVFTLIIIRKQLSHSISINSLSYKQVLSSHWSYGKWVTGSAVINWFNSFIIVPFVAFFVGYAEAGIFRALQNFVQPVQQFLAATTNYLLPKLSAQTKDSDATEIIKKSKKILFFISAVVLIYVILLVCFRTPLINLVYSNHDYLAYSWLLLFFGIELIFDTISQILSIPLRALQRPDSVFWSQLGGVIAFLLSGIILVIHFKLIGAGWNQVITSATNLLVILFFIKLITKKNNTKPLQK